MTEAKRIHKIYINCGCMKYSPPPPSSNLTKIFYFYKIIFFLRGNVFLNIFLIYSSSDIGCSLKTNKDLVWREINYHLNWLSDRSAKLASSRLWKARDFSRAAKLLSCRLAQSVWYGKCALEYPPQPLLLINFRVWPVNANLKPKYLFLSRNKKTES